MAEQEVKNKDENENKEKESLEYNDDKKTEIKVYMEEVKEIETNWSISKDIKIDPNQLFYGSGGWLPGPVRIRLWRQKIINEDIDYNVTLEPSVEALGKLIKENQSIKYLTNTMIQQQKALNRKIGQIETIEVMLFGLNVLIQKPIIFMNNNMVGTPIAAWVNGLDATLSGQTLFRTPVWNTKFRNILIAYNNYLNSAPSWPQKNNSWLTDTAKEQWAPPPVGLKLWILPQPQTYPYWDSWNNFFSRDINRYYRPIAGKDSDNIITSPNDGALFRWRVNIKKNDMFWLKNMPYSLDDIFGDELSPEYAKSFIGGMIWQTFLNPYNYHCWWSPVNGTVKVKTVLPGLYYSKLVLPDIEGATTASCPYLTQVNARGIVIIDTTGYANIGLVCCIPIGMVEVSSILYEKDIEVDKPITKGQKLGKFQFGGSSFVIIFENLLKYKKALTFMADYNVYDDSPLFPMNAPGPAPTGGGSSVDVQVGMQIGVITQFTK